MKLRHENVYRAPAAEVFAMLVDPVYRQRVARVSDAISCSAAFGGGKLVVREERAVKGVPAFAKRVLGDSTVAIHTEVWDAAGTSGTFETQTPGRPAHISGSVTLTESDGRTVHAYDLDIDAPVPLVGRRLARLVGSMATSGFAKEHEVGVAWLAGER